MMNSDPQPWVLCSPGVFGVRSANDGGRSNMGWEWVYSPRPEYDIAEEMDGA